MKDSHFSSTEKIATFMLEAAPDLANLFQTLANENRVQILANLVFGRQTLANLQEITGFQASMLGNHLSILVEAGLVKKLGRGLYDISQDGLDLLHQVCEVYLDLKIREKKRLEYLQALIGRYAGSSVVEDDTMAEITDNLQVRMVELAPFGYVSFQALGTQPETVALGKMISWAKDHGYLDDMASHNIYGFNNPDPMEGKEEYGYEVWLVVNPAEIRDEKVHHFDGGKYAVTTTKIFPLNDEGVIPAWPRLVTWAEQNGYQMGNHQWLERILSPLADESEAYLDLYLPVE